MRKTFAEALLVLVLLSGSALGWGEKGHYIVNRLALDAAANNLPPFMRSSAAQLVYNAYEPDRWREEVDTPMNEAQALDHFFDSEMWGDIATIAPSRYPFMAKLLEKKADLSKVGYLPYAIVENYGRLRNAFRKYRNAQTPEDREAARANAVFYAGLLGHYVGDGSMPMHLSIHFNGWAEGASNPKNFTKDRMFHSRYENAYVNAAVSDAQVRPFVQGPKRLNDVFGAVKDYLRQTFSELEPMYALEQTGEFKPEAPRPKGTAFIAGQLGRAATMLGNLWYTAWIESGEPVPVPAAR
jgi:hypothetical protein